MQLGFAHCPLEAKNQTVIDQCWMINAVAISNESISDSAEIKQTIPIGIVTCEPGDLEAENDTDMAERDFSSQASKAAAFDHTISRNSQICDDQPSAVAFSTKAYCRCVDSR